MRPSREEQTDFLKKLGIDPDLPLVDVLRLVREAHVRLDEITRKVDTAPPDEFVADINILRCEMVRASREVKARAGQV